MKRFTYQFSKSLPKQYTISYFIFAHSYMHSLIAWRIHSLPMRHQQMKLTSVMLLILYLKSDTLSSKEVISISGVVIFSIRISLVFPTALTYGNILTKFNMSVEVEICVGVNNDLWNFLRENVIDCITYTMVIPIMWVPTTCFTYNATPLLRN